MVQTRGKRSRAGCADENRPLKVAKKLIKKREKVKSRVVEQAVSSGEQRTQQQQDTLPERPLLVSCRKAESEKLLLHLKRSVSTRQGTAVYIPGQPGTGKTLTVRNVLSRFPWSELQEEPPACTIVNCMDSVSSLARVCLAGLREAAASVKAGVQGTMLPFLTAGDLHQHGPRPDARFVYRTMQLACSRRKCLQPRA